MVRVVILLIILVLVIAAVAMAGATWANRAFKPLDQRAEDLEHHRFMLREANKMEASGDFVTAEAIRAQAASFLEAMNKRRTTT